jgi:hypothetical protein
MLVDEEQKIFRRKRWGVILDIQNITIRCMGGDLWVSLTTRLLALENMVECLGGSSLSKVLTCVAGMASAMSRRDALPAVGA